MARARDSIGCTFRSGEPGASRLGAASRGIDHSELRRGSVAVDVRVIKPVYSDRARRTGWEGLCIVATHVDRTGYVCRVVLVESTGNEVIDQAALDAVKGWYLVPAKQAGRPVEAIYFTKFDTMLTDVDKWRATRDACLELSRAASGE